MQTERKEAVQVWSSSDKFYSTFLLQNVEHPRFNAQDRTKGGEFAARIRARLGSCTDAGKDRVPQARLCDCSRALPAIRHHSAATGESCTVRARAASITLFEMDTRFLHLAIRQQPYE